MSFTNISHPFAVFTPGEKSSARFSRVSSFTWCALLLLNERLTKWSIPKEAQLCVAWKKWAQKSSKSATRNAMSHPRVYLPPHFPFLKYLNSVYIHYFPCYRLFSFFFFLFLVSSFLYEIGTTVILADFELSNVTCDLDDARDYYTGGRVARNVDVLPRVLIRLLL